MLVQTARAGTQTAGGHGTRPPQLLASACVALRHALLWLSNAASSAPMDGVSGGGLPARIWRAVMTDAART